MITGLQMLDTGVGIALFAWILYWMYSMCSRAHAARKLKRKARQGLQPWRGDRTSAGRLR